MSEQPDNLVLAYLRRMDSKLDGVIDTQREHGLRLTRIETEIGHTVRDRGEDIEARAHLQARLDRLQGEVERIKRRLEITEA